MPLGLQKGSDALRTYVCPLCNPKERIDLFTDRCIYTLSSTHPNPTTVPPQSHLNLTHVSCFFLYSISLLLVERLDPHDVFPQCLDVLTLTLEVLIKTPQILTHYVALVFETVSFALKARIGVAYFKHKNMSFLL